ncbi:RagB/SusD family nutrient uptake outer membrane protein [Dyadobacter frigoris]|uniref:RagB/SusD family nutrient uptake outer membrane protein n=1 Tax=Dyadobacter frigoris TaxID=2576211 RepID=A0A4U6D3B4_9BACT|nr:RagB/SusD family nutrient uptake outer membrane protein [Dyadobacter frigoris]TKT90677.1 RagB/SusD family nutrient uptake outer membrane protein [Dyadobacter frigoris]GLU51168.1 starch-binding protein [Dyadobacter frigoris]
MKAIKHIYYWIAVLIPVLILSACSEDFLERPPQDSIVDASFYQTDDQVLAATALLYSKVWFDYNDKASYNLGDFRAGTAFSAYNDRGNVLFNTTGNTPENGSAWRSFFIVVGQSNLAINNINQFAGTAVSPTVKKMAIAEARFIRALAYRFLVMNWGAVPVIEDNLKLLSDTTVSRNTPESVWKFITSEMRLAANDLPETPIRTGRVTKWSAEGMLARFYLSRSGVESNGSGQRNQMFLDSARYYAERVITRSGASLVKNYSDLFLFPYDNNTESLFSLQWVYSPGAYGTQNTSPAYLAYSSDIANGDGWGGDKSATWWMISQYDGIKATATGMQGRTLDQRLKATFMLPGASYPEITQSITGGEQKLIFPFTGTDNNFLSIKKYITGKAKDVGGLSASQNYGNDTYMMRLAEMYLIYAEAVLGNNASTTDAVALAHFNKIHMRAGLAAFEGPLTMDAIFKERTLEFAMEGMSWYDLVSLHYYNPAKAYAILNAQDRGLFFTVPDQFPNPTSWTFTKTSWATNERTINANSGNFLLPIPSAELSQAPNLQKPAVDYYKK